MRNFSALLLTLGLFPACITPYSPNVHNPATGYLVVEGNLNKDQATTITLSRTTPISDTATQQFQTGATVQVEGSDGSLVGLPETSPGHYSVDSLPLNGAVLYRLNINTPDGGQYASEFVRVIPTPPIDSISYAWLGDGVHLYVNTHNSANYTKYYQFTYDETWEYHSVAESYYIWDTALRQVVPRTPAQEIYSCWKNVPSSSVVTYTTSNQESDVVHFQLFVIQNGDQRLSYLYSILVDEYGISDSAYNYLQEMATTTEDIGTVFQPVPTQLASNIHSVKDPAEQVVGYLNASAKAEVRYWISEPPGWPYSFTCPETFDVVDTMNNLSSELYYYQGIRPIPPVSPPLCCLYDPAELVLYPEPGTANLIAGYTAWPAQCIDCTMQGGVNVQPSFWP